MAERDIGQEILDGIRDWEQGRRIPSGAAITLLRIAQQRPEIFLELT